jgi:hypothetical protein
MAVKECRWFFSRSGLEPCFKEIIFIPLHPVHLHGCAWKGFEDSVVGSWWIASEISLKKRAIGSIPLLPLLDHERHEWRTGWSMPRRHERLSFFLSLLFSPSLSLSRSLSPPLIQESPASISWSRINEKQISCFRITTAALPRKGWRRSNADHATRIERPRFKLYTGYSDFQKQEAPREERDSWGKLSQLSISPVIGSYLGPSATSGALPTGAWIYSRTIKYRVICFHPDN